MQERLIGGEMAGGIRLNGWLPSGQIGLSTDGQQPPRRFIGRYVRISDNERRNTCSLSPIADGSLDNSLKFISASFFLSGEEAVGERLYCVERYLSKTHELLGWIKENDEKKRKPPVLHWNRMKGSVNWKETSPSSPIYICYFSCVTKVDGKKRVEEEYTNTQTDLLSVYSH